jgi:hypothetical protein
MRDLIIFQGFGSVLLEVAQALAPLVVLFLVFQVFFLRLPRETVLNVLRGTALAFVGLALFLHGVHIGFLPAGREMGLMLGQMPQRWVIVPLGALLGFLSIIAEPAVRVLTTEVERASAGSVREGLILFAVAGGVGLFVALGMIRIIYGLPLLYILIPGYFIALIMMRFTDPGFVSIAFDSGGVATGPMTVTFTLAMAVGVATAIEGRSPVIDGFGLIALVALAPILSVMALGLIFRRGE